VAVWKYVRKSDCDVLAAKLRDLRGVNLKIKTVNLLFRLRFEPVSSGTQVGGLQRELTGLVYSRNCYLSPAFVLRERKRERERERERSVVLKNANVLSNKSKENFYALSVQALLSIY
jgi:hypothetical protein